MEIGEFRVKWITRSSANANHDFIDAYNRLGITKWLAIKSARYAVPNQPNMLAAYLYPISAKNCPVGVQVVEPRACLIEFLKPAVWQVNSLMHKNSYF